MVQDTKAGVLSEVGAAAWHISCGVQMRMAFSLAGKLTATSVCPARAFVKFGSPGVKDGLGVAEERAQFFPKEKG